MTTLENWKIEHWVQVWSQRYKRMYKKFYTWTQLLAKKFLNLSLNNRHFGYITKWTLKEKNSFFDLSKMTTIYFLIIFFSKIIAKNTFNCLRQITKWEFFSSATPQKKTLLVQLVAWLSCWLQVGMRGSVGHLINFKEASKSSKVLLHANTRHWIPGTAMSAGAIRIYEDARATACSLSSLQMHQQQCCGSSSSSSSSGW